MIQGLSERLGVPTVICWRRTNGQEAEQAGTQPTWQRYVLAPKFSSGTACCATDATPLVVKLETVDATPHYVLLQPPRRVRRGTLRREWVSKPSQLVADRKAAEAVKDRALGGLQKLADLGQAAACARQVSEAVREGPAGCSDASLLRACERCLVSQGVLRRLLASLPAEATVLATATQDEPPVAPVPAPSALGRARAIDSVAGQSLGQVVVENPAAGCARRRLSKKTKVLVRVQHSGRSDAAHSACRLVSC